MSDFSLTWGDVFSGLFDEACYRYSLGERDPAKVAGEEGSKFLRTIGYTDQEFFDFIEDFSNGGEPTLVTALAIAAVRRDYFLHAQDGKPSNRFISMDDLPAKDAELDGIAWLPRLLRKAEAKLRGEMPPNLMYGCGGDRKFFRTWNVEPADFLRHVWNQGVDSAGHAEWVRASKAGELRK